MREGDIFTKLSFIMYCCNHHCSNCI